MSSSEEATKQFKEIYEDHNDPIKKDKKYIEKNREEIINERISDLGI